MLVLLQVLMQVLVLTKCENELGKGMEDGR
jgi:hypothetical protein